MSASKPNPRSIEKVRFPGCKPQNTIRLDLRGREPVKKYRAVLKKPGWPRVRVRG